MRAVGGKAYPPYAPFFSRDDWKDHYGPRHWSRLVAGKERFDPSNILTPGMGTAEAIISKTD
jgi:FAD/FMN-containing dehydrogenase